MIEQLFEHNLFFSLPCWGSIEKLARNKRCFVSLLRHLQILETSQGEHYWSASLTVIGHPPVKRVSGSLYSLSPTVSACCRLHELSARVRWQICLACHPLLCSRYSFLAIQYIGATALAMCSGRVRISLAPISFSRHHTLSNSMTEGLISEQRALFVSCSTLAVIIHL